MNLTNSCCALECDFNYYFSWQCRQYSSIWFMYQTDNKSNFVAELWDMYSSGTLHCGYNWTFLHQMYNGWTQYIYIFKIVTVYPLFLSKPLSIFIFLPSLGFHKPPFISVNHLHLHVIAPSSQICDFMIYKFIPGTESFILVSACLLYFIILISVTFHILL